MNNNAWYTALNNTYSNKEPLKLPSEYEGTVFSKERYSLSDEELLNTFTEDNRKVE